MTAWMVLAGILLALWLLSLVRIGAKAEYEAAGFTVWVKIGPWALQVFPGKPGKEKKPPKPKAEKPPAEKKGGSFALVKEMLPLVAQAAGRFKRKVRIDRLCLDFSAAAQDPAAAAMSFGYANAAIGMIWPLLAHNFNIKEKRIRTKVDFQQTAPTVYLWVEATLTVGQAVVLGVSLLVQFLGKYRSYKREHPAAEQKQKEAV